MPRSMSRPARSLAKTIVDLVRYVIDGPNPSAPYSWAGTKDCASSSDCTKCNKSDGYVGIC